MTAVTPPTQAATATLLEAFARTLERRPDAIAVRTLDGSSAWSWRDLDARARRFASGLRALGIGPGDTVGVLLTNDLHFYEADLAVVMAGAVPVPIYATAAPEQIAHLAADAGLTAAITQAMFASALHEGLAEQPDCSVICLEPGIAGCLDWDEVASAPPLESPHQAAAGDLLTIIYTSGTTGPSKGVELTHGGLMAATDAVADFAHLDDGGRVISWLPLAHIAERIASYYAAVRAGLEVVVCPDPTKVAEYLPAVQPAFFFAVPRFWEKLRTGIEAKVAALPDEVRENFAARNPDLMGVLRQMTGFGEIRIAAIGAAPSDASLVEFFHELGIPLGEIYGLTESAACCTANPKGRIRVGSAGLPMPGMEVRLAEDGEVELRGASLMRGYRNQPEATAEAFTPDGWLRTGDVGRIDEDGYLWIVDRKKDLIINAAGKNMSPANIESAIKSGGAEIAHVCVVGDGRPYNVALIAPDPEVVGLAEDWPDDLAERIDAAVSVGNLRLSRVEQVKRWHVVRDPWLPGTDEVTPTMKLRRANVMRRYASEIDALYGQF